MLRNVVAAVCVCLAILNGARGAESVFTFENPGDRFVPASGAATLEPFDPDFTGWSDSETIFDTATNFGLPVPPGGDKVVMRFPACTPRQGYLLSHAGSPNGTYGDLGWVSNYTLIFDVLYPTESDGQWRALYQADVANADDAEIYVRNQPSGGVGINGEYRGSVTANAWHRIVVTVRAAPGEGQLHKYIDGVFVGGQGTTGSGIDLRWALDQQLLLLTEDNDENAGGYLCGFYFTDRQMTPDEVRALGGVNSAAPNVAGAPAGPLPQQLPRLARAIGHRGASSIRPENTLPSLMKCFADGAYAIESDTRISADGHAVIFHDSTVDRTTNGFGDVSSFTVAELKALDAGSWFDPIYAGTTIPTLAEYMQALPAGKILYLDLKINDATMVAALRQAFDAAGFSEDRWWLYVYDNTAFAELLHAEFPNSAIIWEGLPANWQTNPNAFDALKALGVKGFDFGGNGAALTPALALRLKQEDLIPAAYTILDPDNMMFVAARGADFMETDFPAILRDITPALGAGATLPSPADGVMNASPTILSWMVGANTTAHRVHFGAANPPPFVLEQTYDLFGLPALDPGTTYFWRIDEVTPGGTVDGPVWSFTTPGGVVSNAGALYEWNFSDGDLAASLGAGTLDYADASTPSLVSLGTTGGVVPDIDGQSATFVQLPAFTELTNGLSAELNLTGPNGGGVYVNQYSIIFDIYSAGAPGWQALFQTNPDNPEGNDADFYIAPDNSVGIAAIGYSAPGVFTQDAWHRLIFSVDLEAGRAAYYIDGVQVFERTGMTGFVDGRFSLYSNVDPGPDIRFFNEGDTSDIYTHELYVSALAIRDRELTAAEAAELGAPQARGIYSLAPGELPRLTIRPSAGGLRLEWLPVASFHLQRTISLLNPWEDVPATAGRLVLRITRCQRTRLLPSPAPVRTAPIKTQTFELLERGGEPGLMANFGQTFSIASAGLCRRVGCLRRLRPPSRRTALPASATTPCQAGACCPACVHACSANSSRRLRRRTRPPDRPPRRGESGGAGQCRAAGLAAPPFANAVVAAGVARREDGAGDPHLDREAVRLDHHDRHCRPESAPSRYPRWWPVPSSPAPG